MLKALYDYGMRRQLALPPGFVEKTIKAYISLQNTMTMSASTWEMEKPSPARISAVWPTERTRATSLRRSAPW